MIIAGFWIYPLYLGFYNIEYLPPPLTPGMTTQAHMESTAECCPNIESEFDFWLCIYILFQLLI